MRRSFSVAALMAILAGAIFVAAPATAQTGYPPVCNSADIPQFAGTFTVGETFSVTIRPPCIFTPGQAVNVTVNGVAVGTKIADASGAVIVHVRAVSATELLIDDPVSVPARCGINTAVGTGPSAVARRNVTQTVNFELVCPGVGPGSRPKAVSGRVAFTGANVAKWALVALILVGIGAVLVTLNRRRRHADS